MRRSAGRAVRLAASVVVLTSVVVAGAGVAVPASAATGPDAPHAGTATDVPVEPPVETPVDPPVEPAPPMTFDVRVETYNVCAEKCPRLHSWPSRATNVAAHVASYSPDVLTTNESGSTERNNAVLSHRLAAKGYTRSAGYSRAIYYKSSRFSSVGADGKPLAREAFGVWSGVKGARRRGGAYAVLRDRGTGGLVLVVNVHLTALGRKSKDTARLREFIKVYAIVAKVRRANPDATVVFAGDFNGYRRIKPRVAQDAYRHNVADWIRARTRFRDAVPLAESLAPGSSGNTINKLPGDHRYFGPFRHLDHIYVDPSTRVRKFGLFNRDVPYSQQFSDHDPVYADLTLPVSRR